MTTQNNLTVYVGEGPWQFDWQIIQDGLPLNLTSITVQIVFKSSPDQIDPTTGSNVFNVSNSGLTITNSSNGQGTWNVAASFFTEPGVYWWHGTMVIGGATFTWGFGDLTVVAV